jgi:hypothetical protein
MGSAWPYELVKNFMLHIIKRIFMVENRVCSQFSNLVFIKVNLDKVPTSLTVTPESRDIIFCFLFDSTYLTQATKRLPSVVVELELETTNNLLHQLHYNFLTPPTSIEAKSFQILEVLYLCLLSFALFLAKSTARGVFVKFLSKNFQAFYYASSVRCTINDLIQLSFLEKPWTHGIFFAKNTPALYRVPCVAFFGQNKKSSSQKVSLPLRKSYTTVDPF